MNPVELIRRLVGKPMLVEKTETVEKDTSVDLKALLKAKPAERSTKCITIPFLNSSEKSFILHKEAFLRAYHSNTLITVSMDDGEMLDGGITIPRKTDSGIPEKLSAHLKNNVVGRILDYSILRNPEDSKEETIIVRIVPYGNRHSRLQGGRYDVAGIIEKRMLTNVVLLESNKPSIV